MANYLTTLRGTLAGGSLSEIFSHSLVVVSTKEPSALVADLITQWTAAVNTGPPILAAQFAPTVAYTEATVAEIMNLSTGDLSVATHGAFGVVVGTGAAALPSQNAVAVSLTGGQKPNGAPIKGRFYLPTPAQLVANVTDGIMSDGMRQGYIDGIANYLNGLQGLGNTPSVWSRVYSIVAPIAQLRVGNQIDTIRRRRNAQVEVYSTQQI